MGKQDEAVTSILCVVDLGARTCNGSTPRNILVVKRFLHEETDAFHMVLRAPKEKDHLWLGGSVKLDCSASSTDPWKVHPLECQNSSCWMIYWWRHTGLFNFKDVSSRYCTHTQTILNVHLKQVWRVSCCLHNRTFKLHTHTHTLSSKLTPVSGCAVQANSVVAHFVSISVSVNRIRKKTTRSDKEEQGDTGYQYNSKMFYNVIKLSKNR